MPGGSFVVINKTSGHMSKYRRIVCEHGIVETLWDSMRH